MVEADLVHAFVHARPTTTWTGPDRTAPSGRYPEPSIRRSEQFWLVRRHIRERPPVRLLIRPAGFETLAAHTVLAGQGPLLHFLQDRSIPIIQSLVHARSR